MVRLVTDDNGHAVGVRGPPGWDGAEDEKCGEEEPSHPVLPYISTADRGS
jgi:hypothetical protein